MSEMPDSVKEWIGKTVVAVDRRVVAERGL